MKPGTANDELMTIGQMARKMGRSILGVRKAVRRMEIQPAAKSGKVMFYHSAETIGLLEEGMRAKNLPV